MNKAEQIKFISQLLKMHVEEVEKYSDTIEELNALYFSVPEKGGHSFIVGEDGSFLYADSTIDFNKHLEQFKTGKRTEYNGDKNG